MKRRSFIKGVAAAGSLSLLPAGVVGSVLSGCSGKGPEWDFDEVVDRSGTWSIKHGRAGEGQLPMWIADMDFKTDPHVSRALQERISRDAMGYTFTPNEFYDSIAAWQLKRHGYAVQREWIGYAPGVITAINQAYLVFSEPGDKVVVQSPVYDHFRLYAERLGRTVVENPLIYEDGRYRMDLEGLEALIDERTKILVLCNPHNPGGICWDADSLRALASICARRGVLVFSDEIHSDLVLGGGRHVPFCSVSDEAAAIGLIFSGPTKSFNLAGISGTAYCIIPDKSLRDRYRKHLSDAKLGEASIMSLVATIAAYSHEPRWLDSLLAYLQGNVDCLCDFLDSRSLGIRAVRPEASFLVWLDCRGLGLGQSELMSFFRDDVGILLNDGSSYGSGGEGFVRLNIGCPRSVLMTALERIAAAVGAR